jgi:hypothetical protein
MQKKVLVPDLIHIEADPLRSQQIAARSSSPSPMVNWIPTRGEVILSFIGEL